MALLPITAELLNLVCAGLLAGAFVLTRFGLRPAAAALEPRAHIALRRELIRVLGRLIPCLFGVALATSALVLAVDGRSAGFQSRVSACALLVATMVVTLGGNVPLNRRMLTWLPQSPPPRWQHDVMRWDRLDTVRSLTAMASLLFQSLGMWQRIVGL